MEILETTVLGNSLRVWAAAIGATLVTFAAIRIVGMRLIRRFVRIADHTENRWDDVVASALDATRSVLLLIVALFVGVNVLTLPDRVASILHSIAAIALLVQSGLWMSVVGVAARLVLWSMVLLLTLDNMGVDVTALVAGLGIGGVAVALAAQNILGDLFASLSIVLDKPFVLGDFLAVGDFLGSVEQIGLKTTRVRSLSGEQLVFSNADLLSSRIRNFGRMYERRVVSRIGVTYQTPRDKLERIPQIIREAVEAEGERVRFDRSHFQTWGDFSIVFETVYYVLSAEYNVHMDIQQAIAMRVHERFEAEAIEFAYPTQTILLAQSG